MNIYDRQGFQSKDILGSIFDEINRQDPDLLKSQLNGWGGTQNSISPQAAYHELMARGDVIPMQGTPSPEMEAAANRLLLRFLGNSVIEYGTSNPL